MTSYPAPPASPPASPPTFEKLMHDATGGLVSYVELGVGAGLVVLFIICCCVCLRCIIRYRHRRKYPPAQRYATQASNASVASEGSVPPPVPSSRAWSAEQGRVTQIEHSTRDEVAPPAPALHGWDRLRAAHDTTSALRAAGTPLTRPPTPARPTLFTADAA